MNISDFVFCFDWMFDVLFWMMKLGLYDGIERVWGFDFDC